MPRKKTPRRAILRACLIIISAMVFYAGVLKIWLPSSSRTPDLAPSARAAHAALIRARQIFRDNFLDVRAHLRLSEALYKDGRPIDGFYVMFAARQLFGPAVFSRAHSLIVLHGDDPDATLEDVDPQPADKTKIEQRAKEQPDNPYPAAALAHILAQRGSTKDALAALNEISTLFPDNAILLLAHAQIAQSPAESIPYYARAAAAAPNTYEGRASFKELEQLAQKPMPGINADTSQLARQALEEIYQAKPNESLAFTTLARALLNNGESDRVRALVLEARNRNPRDAGASQIEGLLDLIDKKTNASIEHFAFAQEMDSTDLISAAKLAQIYDSRPENAENALFLYLALYRYNPDYANPALAERRVRELLDARRIQKLKDAAVSQLQPYFSSDDASVRAEACERAALFKDARWIDNLAALLDDDTEIVRHNADYALYQIALTSPESVRARKNSWLSSEKPLLRTRALNLFADWERNNTLPAVQTALDDPNPMIRFLTKALVLDRYYTNDPASSKIRDSYLKKEKDPNVLALYARWPTQTLLKQ